MAKKRIDQVSDILGLPGIKVSDYDRVGNSIRAMVADFKSEWNENFRHSSSVPIGVVIPDGKWPIISFELQKTLMYETQCRLRRDITKRKARADAIKKLAATEPPKGKDKVKRERTKPQSGSPCGFFKRNGHCKFGDACLFSHSTTTVAMPAAAPGAIKPPIDPKDAKTFTCTEKSSAACTKTFVLDMAYWQKRIDENQWTLPPGCDSCRAVKKEKRAVAQAAKGNNS